MHCRSETGLSLYGVRDLVLLTEKWEFVPKHSVEADKEIANGSENGRSQKA